MAVGIEIAIAQLRKRAAFALHKGADGTLSCLVPGVAIERPNNSLPTHFRFITLERKTMYSIFQKVSFVLALGLTTACAADETEVAQSSDPGTSANSASADSVEATAGKQFADTAYAGLIDLGTQDGWTLYFDKDNNEVVATDGKQSVTFDPNSLEDDAVMASLVASGIPETLLWSWKGVLCRAACWGAAAAGCAAVAAVCAVGTTFTVGGFAIPCTWAVIAACGASGGSASVCSDWCTKKYG